MEAGERLRRARQSAGMTQTALARVSGVSQPNIAAYEAGRRSLSAAMLRRLLIALGARPSAAIRAHRQEILDAARRHGGSHVRVFGSIARGDDTVDSDVDLLVTFAPGTSLFDLAELTEELEQILGIAVDVVSDGGFTERTEAALRDSVLL